MKSLVLPLFLSTMFPAAAAAGMQDSDATSTAVEFSQAYSDCASQAADILPNMLACNDAEYTWQSKRLNSAYQALLKQLPKGDQGRLREIQRNWMQARNGTCAFYYKLGKGEASGIEHSVCLMRGTARRAALLEAWGNRLGS